MIGGRCFESSCDIHLDFRFMSSDAGANLCNVKIQYRQNGLISYQLNLQCFKDKSLNSSFSPKIKVKLILILVKLLSDCRY